jgi:hypothetical protein
MLMWPTADLDAVKIEDLSSLAGISGIKGNDLLRLYKGK